MISEEIKIIALVGLGGALGSIARYLIHGYIGDHDFPWGTFVVNFLGSLLLSMIFFSSLGAELDPSVKAFLFVGIFGGFTTMSTFSLDTVGLIIAERFNAALFNIFLNGGLCVFGGLVGRWLALSLI
ncbi:MAG: fluoride efflux transporter CrcB [Methanomassiliicoccaceae archaeon]|nr:fluoride efflux transporter CrcB [Euryarchaeota archaeon]HOB39185.1 fluoride efflux transporter CrcB [Methanomassiliicoccaceae archaeon]HOL07970.1 fluoride efflux transporter CrcB [Methanomassiliicoccaceae archaeon]HQA21915.1 fluoride efflux transporter CrcB [Methanomassiliicoccaceae archaeon]